MRDSFLLVALCAHAVNTCRFLIRHRGDFALDPCGIRVVQIIGLCAKLT